MKKTKLPFDDKNISKGAMKGALTGMAIGYRFGPYGIAIGATLGGITGYVIEELKQANQKWLANNGDIKA